MHGQASANVLQVTAAQYCDFLNHVAASDSNFLYDEKMSSDPRVACIVREATPECYEYFVTAGRENMPITYVNKKEMSASVDDEKSDAFLKSNNITFCITNDESMGAFSELSLASSNRSASSITASSLSIVGNVVLGVAGVAFCSDLMLGYGNNAGSLEEQPPFSRKDQPLNPSNGIYKKEKAENKTVSNTSVDVTLLQADVSKDELKIPVSRSREGSSGNLPKDVSGVSKKQESIIWNQHAMKQNDDVQDNDVQDDDVYAVIRKKIISCRSIADRLKASGSELLAGLTYLEVEKWEDLLWEKGSYETFPENKLFKCKFNWRVNDEEFPNEKTPLLKKE